MTFELNVIFSLSIAIAASLSWIRFGHISPAYHPFVFLINLDLINEITSMLVVRSGYSNSVNYNVYSLVEFLLITWQFKRWKLFARWKNLYVFLQVSALAFWITENFIFKNLQSFNSYFVIVSSYVIVLMSIHRINQLVHSTDELIRNAGFIICLCFVFYFTYAVLVEAFWVYGLSKSTVFVTRIYSILIYINLFINLAYAIAVLWIPAKPKFILPS